MTVKLLKKISVGGINGVRGGFKNVKERFIAMTIIGIAGAYKEKTSENMATSYGFLGEFQAINKEGEKAIASVAYLPEPAQGMLKGQIDSLQSGGNVEFGFRVYVAPSEKSPMGYEFEIEPLMEARSSTALENLASNLLALGHDKGEEKPEEKVEEAAHKGKGGKGK